jgi:putative tryptophan/tyrosine transport system substrate-binding protein
MIGAMRRRTFLTLLGGAAAAWPVAARAQDGRVRRVGVLMNAAATETEWQSYLAAFIQGLRQSGWTEGQNLRIDVRWNAGDAGLSRIYAAQLIGLIPDVILAVSTINLTVIKQATSTVPVVFVNVNDPVTQGLVASMSHPGGNVTGFSILEFSLGGKWLDLLKEIAPGLARIAVMFNPETAPYSRFFMPVIEAAAIILGVQVIAAPVRATPDIEAALVDFARQPNGGLMMLSDSFMRLHQKLIVDLAGRHRLPSIASGFDFAKDGGLMDYGPNADLARHFRQAATYVDRILKGAKPGDLPVQAPTSYRLVLNLKTAKALGLTVSPLLLTIADEVIE